MFVTLVTVAREASYRTGRGLAGRNVWIVSSASRLLMSPLRMVVYDWVVSDDPVEPMIPGPSAAKVTLTVTVMGSLHCDSMYASAVAKLATAAAGTVASRL